MKLFEAIKDKFLTKNHSRKGKEPTVDPKFISNQEDTTVTHSLKQRDDDFVLDQYDPYSVFGLNIHNASFSQNETIKQWRNYSLYPESKDCLDTITNEAINRDDKGDFIRIDLDDIVDMYGKKSAKPLIDEIRFSYDKFNLLTNFEEDAETLFKRHFIDGALYYEVVYPKDENKRKEEGITDCILLSPLGFKKVIIKNPIIQDKDRFYNDNKEYVTPREADLIYANMENEDNAGYSPNREYTFYYYDETYDNDQQTNDYQKPNFGVEESDEKKIFDEEQIVSCDSGDYDNTKKMYLSYINPCIRSLRNLYMIEDAIIIYRLQYSHAKRAFHINTKKMNRKNAETYLRKLMDRYSSQMYYNTSDGSITTRNSTQAIGENYWFLKNDDGTKSVDIESVEALTNFDITNLADLDYFVNKVQKAFRVPINRRDRKESSTMYNYDTNNTILREEARFTKNVTAIKRRFIQMIYEFIYRDLVARNIIAVSDWYDIKKYIKFRFNGENEFARIQKFGLLQQQADLSDRLINYVTGEIKFFSKKWLLKTVWEMTDEEIEEQKEQIELEQIEEKERLKDKEQAVGGDEYGDFGGVGADIGGGYDRPFEPLNPDAGDIGGDVFPDFESPEEMGGADKQPTIHEEPITDSVEPVEYDNIILDNIRKQTKEGETTTLNNKRYIKRNGLLKPIKGE